MSEGPLGRSGPGESSVGFVQKICVKHRRHEGSGEEGEREKWLWLGRSGQGLAYTGSLELILRAPGSSRGTLGGVVQRGEGSGLCRHETTVHTGCSVCTAIVSARCLVGVGL